MCTRQTLMKHVTTMQVCDCCVRKNGRTMWRRWKADNVVHCFYLMYRLRNLRWKSFRTVSLMKRRASFLGSRD